MGCDAGDQRQKDPGLWEYRGRHQEYFSLKSEKVLELSVEGALAEGGASKDNQQHVRPKL